MSLAKETYHLVQNGGPSEEIYFDTFNRTRVRSLAMLVTHSLPNSLTPVSKRDLCEPDM